MNKKEKTLELIENIKKNIILLDDFLTNTYKTEEKEDLHVKSSQSLFIDNLSEPQSAPQTVDKLNKEKSEFQKINSDSWPKCVNENFIETPLQIIDYYLDVDMSNVESFLDFGCGEGNVSLEASKEIKKISVGYDIKKYGNNSWENLEKKHFLTTNLNKVKSLGPYDVILLYNVLEYVNNIDETIKTIKKMLKKDGLIFLRLTPWTSRKGFGVAENLNKAFVHLIYDTKFLEKELGLNLKVRSSNIKIENFLKSNSLKILRKKEKKQKVESFFYKIIKNINKKDLELLHVDYVLKKEKELENII